jgi:hypothetical protein
MYNFECDSRRGGMLVCLRVRVRVRVRVRACACITFKGVEFRL